METTVFLRGLLPGWSALLGLTCSFLSGARAPLPLAGPLISSGETILGERIVYPTGAPAKVTAAIVTLAPGQETGWNIHGAPVLGYVLEGELEVDYGDKGLRVYREGEAMLEAIGVPHNGRNIGSGTMRILAVFMGAEGLQPSVPAPR
ncbi:MAG TPA: cupin domain-containing protein [Hyphomicrobium sp.]|nr:cupin domain-containing protein [Hyphomicrobium sp.]